MTSTTGWSCGTCATEKAWVSRHAAGPANIPCPTTGRLLRVATIDAEAAAICPRCSSHARGGFVSFVGDLRMAYACPSCCELVWLAGASANTEISDFRFQIGDWRLAIGAKGTLARRQSVIKSGNQNLQSKSEILNLNS